MSSLLLRNISALTKALTITNYYPQRCISLSAVDLRARKGTREKALKKKVKVEVKKVGFIPHNQRYNRKLKIHQFDRHLSDDLMPLPIDDVWMFKHYRSNMYSIAEAIQCHKETHHPTMYFTPNAYLDVHIELNMAGEKKNKFVNNFNRICLMPHAFTQEENRSILAFCKDAELQEQAMAAGAKYSGGLELVKRIQNGDMKLDEYDFIIAHSNILTDLVPLRGLMKKKFPNPKVGTVGSDVINMVTKFCNGVRYAAATSEYQENFAVIDAHIGQLNMDNTQLEENIIALIKDVNDGRPKRAGKFITRCYLKCPPGDEQLKIDPFLFVESGEVSELPPQTEEDQEDSDAEDIEEKAKQTAAAANA